MPFTSTPILATLIFIIHDSRFCYADSVNPISPLKEKCVFGRFKCRNQRCISNQFLCDKYNDCEDDSDEDPKFCAPKQFCQSNEFHCKQNRRCIPLNWYCDGDNDCYDHSDEVDCKTSCELGWLQCYGNNSVICIQKQWLCDGKADCVDGWDESGCQFPGTDSNRAQNQAQNKAAMLESFQSTGTGFSGTGFAGKATAFQSLESNANPKLNPGLNWNQINQQNQFAASVGGTSTRQGPAPVLTNYEENEGRQPSGTNVLEGRSWNTFPQNWNDANVPRRRINGFL